MVLFTYPNWEDVHNQEWVQYCQKGGIETVAIINDLLHPYGTSLEEEVNMLNDYSYVMSHSERMKSFLKESGVIRPVVNLSLFDYPINPDVGLAQIERWLEAGTEPKERNSIAYAGKVWHPLREWIFSEHLKDIPIHLYYDLTEEEQIKLQRHNQWDNLHYGGNFWGVEIYDLLEGDYGLIWNGDDCGEGMFEWKKISISSKLDFCLAGGLPIIAKRGTIDGDLIEQHHIGLTINHLSELENAISAISHEEYMTYQANLAPLARRAVKGENFREVLEQIAGARLAKG